MTDRGPARGVVGCNALGAWRTAAGMRRRGEVALIIAGVGVAAGVIDRQIFGVGVLMTVVTTVPTPILLVPAFKRKRSGLRNPDQPDLDPRETAPRWPHAPEAPAAQPVRR